MKVNIINHFDLKKVMARLNKNIPRMINDAAGIIKSDISDGIKYGRNIDGSPFKTLKAQTIKAKRRKGSPHPRRVLYDTGMMQNTYMKRRATRTRMSAILKVANKRSYAIKGYKGGIGQLHHEGGANHPKRPWFGISKTASANIKKDLRINIKHALGKEWKLS